MVQVLILAYDGCVAGAVGAPADLFLTANHLSARLDPDTRRTPVFSVRTASLDGEPVVCGNGQTLTPQAAIDEIDRVDLVIAPGLLVESEATLLASLSKLGALSAFLRRTQAQGALLASGCTGAFVLAEAGLLDHQSATTTWWLAELFRRRYPNVALDPSRLVVESGPFVTAAAGASYLDLSLLLIGRFAGPGLARHCAAYLCVDGPRESQNAYAIPHHRQSRDPFIEQADQWIRAHAAEPIDMPTLARRLNVSLRTLVRRFKEKAGQTPSDYVQQVRIDKAKFLLQNTRMGVSQIAGQVGYRDEDAFRRAFKKQSRLTPAEFRRRSNQF